MRIGSVADKYWEIQFKKNCIYYISLATSMAADESSVCGCCVHAVHV